MKTLQSMRIALLFLFIAQFVLAQEKKHVKITLDSYGLYASYNDFRLGKLTYPMDCKNSEDKIKLNDWFGSSRGYIWYHGERHSFDKNQVYGYRDCKKNYHRFFQGEAYKILDTAGFYLYYKYVQKEITKGKGLVKTDEYYFSAHGDDPIRSLTGENMKNAFSENHRFQYALDAGFQSEKELIAYDDFQKIYKIKYLYNQSLK